MESIKKEAESSAEIQKENGRKQESGIIKGCKGISISIDVRKIKKKRKAEMRITKGSKGSN